MAESHTFEVTCVPPPSTRSAPIRKYMTYVVGAFYDIEWHDPDRSHTLGRAAGIFRDEGVGSGPFVSFDVFASQILFDAPIRINPVFFLKDGVRIIEVNPRDLPVYAGFPHCNERLRDALADLTFL